MTRQVAPDDHLYAKGNASPADSHIWGRRIDEPVRANICGSPEHISSDLVQHLSFIRDRTGKDHVESGNPVGCDHNQPFIGDRINVADFSAVEAGLMWELQLLAHARKIKFSRLDYNMYFSNTQCRTWKNRGRRLIKEKTCNEKKTIAHSGIGHSVAYAGFLSLLFTEFHYRFRECPPGRERRPGSRGQRDHQGYLYRNVYGRAREFQADHESAAT